MPAPAIERIGDTLAMKWLDGTEGYLSVRTLRERCPCAGCLGETDVKGVKYQAPRRTLGAHAFDLQKLVPVGGYAVQPVWGDGHATGIYSFEYLRRLSEESPG